MSDARLRDLERRAELGDAEAASALAAAQERSGQAGPGPLHGIVLIVGARGCGKTLFLQELEARGRAQRCPMVVWDRMGHWKDGIRLRTVIRSDDAEEAAARAIELAPCTLVMDEAALAIPADHAPKEGSAIREILFTGRQARGVGRWRRRGPVSLLAACQRPATVHASVRGLLDRLYIGRFPSSALLDLKWIESVTDAETAREATQLPVGKFIWRDP